MVYICILHLKFCLLLTVLHSASLLAPAAMESAPLTFKLIYHFSIVAAYEFNKDFKKRYIRWEEWVVQAK
jgi:hypothetical protein